MHHQIHLLALLMELVQETTAFEFKAKAVSQGGGAGLQAAIEMIGPFRLAVLLCPQHS